MNSASMSNANRYFEEHQGAIAISTRVCRTYKLDIEHSDPPTFTDHFKKAVQKLHELTQKTNPFRIIVVKTGERSFGSTLNRTTERKYDLAFSEFVRKYGTHYQDSVEMGGAMYAVSKTKNWVSEVSLKKDAKVCVEAYHRKKYSKYDLSQSNNSTQCSDPIIDNILKDRNEVVADNIYSIGAPLGAPNDASTWSTGEFKQPAVIDMKLSPILKMFMSDEFLNKDRILAEDGTLIDAPGILSWFQPRFSILTDSCRALLNFRVSSDFSSCEECPLGYGPTEDFRDCKPCPELTGTE